MSVAPAGVALTGNTPGPESKYRLAPNRNNQWPSRLQILSQSAGVDVQTNAAATTDPMAEALWALEGLKAHSPEGGAVLYTGAVDLPTGGAVQWQYGLAASTVLAQDWTDHAGLLDALGHPVRLAILHAVLHGTVTPSGLVEALDSGTSGQVYHHLKELTAMGWLAPAGRGVYEVPAARVVPLLAILVAVGTPR